MKLMHWIKKGLIYSTKGEVEWSRTHAALPVADRLEHDLYRIYYTTRDSQNRSSIAFVEIDMKNPTRILQVSEEPVLSPGELGSFDDSGTLTTSLVNYDGKKYLYYIGWNLGVTVPFRWAVGLAISKDNGETFQRYSQGPIMDRDPIDPLFLASPTVLRENNLWKMWYISGTKWREQNGELIAPYHMKYAESKDGINWTRTGMVCIGLKENDLRIARGSILKEGNIYKMWYSFVTDRYRMGYAESSDGKNWKRKDDEAGIDISDSGWDSESVEYPFVFDHDGVRYMLYNGNNYGETGFGYAILEEER